MADSYTIQMLESFDARLKHLEEQLDWVLRIIQQIRPKQETEMQSQDIRFVTQQEKIPETT